jgi:hypothetical protein
MRLVDEVNEKYWADDVGFTAFLDNYEWWMPLPAHPAE